MARLERVQTWRILIGVMVTTALLVGTSAAADAAVPFSAKHAISAPAPTISGAKQAGKTLTVKLGTVKPTGVTKSYQWYRNGAKVSGATKSTYALKNVDAGGKITVKVTYAKKGYTTKTLASKATGAIAKRTPSIINGGDYSPIGIPAHPSLAPGLYFADSVNPSCLFQRYEVSPSDVILPFGDGGVGRRYVQILGYELFFRSLGCGDWQQYDGTGGAKAKTISQPGMYKVGFDIVPGVYRVSSPEYACVVATYKDASYRDGSITQTFLADDFMTVYVDSATAFLHVGNCASLTWLRSTP